MSELQLYDKGNPKIPPHKKPSISDDEFETPNELYVSLCAKYQIFPTLDVAATKENRKCLKFFSKEDNGLEQEWDAVNWINHPHTLHEQFVIKAYQQLQKGKISMQIIPANTMRTKYWHKYIEDFVKYHAIEGAITFLKEGKPTEFASRNAYVVVIWR